MPTLLWFRRDLRLYELPSLLDAAATASSAEVHLTVNPASTGRVMPVM
jgi:deoxyribodipyrimidine photolyase